LKGVYYAKHLLLFLSLLGTQHLDS
jgi:hypothetical protein